MYCKLIRVLTIGIYLDTGRKSIIPSHNLLNYRPNLESTYATDYSFQLPIPSLNQNTRICKVDENVLGVYKRNLSSFSEAEAYRIPGTNTFQDNHGEI